MDTTASNEPDSNGSSSAVPPTPCSVKPKFCAFAEATSSDEEGSPDSAGSTPTGWSRATEVRTYVEDRRRRQQQYMRVRQTGKCKAKHKGYNHVTKGYCTKMGQARFNFSEDARVRSKCSHCCVPPFVELYRHTFDHVWCPCVTIHGVRFQKRQNYYFTSISLLDENRSTAIYRGLLLLSVASKLKGWT